MNDHERELWILNDEGLYRQWKASKQPIQTYIRDHRDEIDQVIAQVSSGKKPPHYLAYGG